MRTVAGESLRLDITSHTTSATRISGTGYPEPVPLPDEQGGAEDADEDQGDAAAALVEAQRLLQLAVLGKQDPARGVHDQAGATEQGQHHERDAHDERVDVEVPGDAARDAGDLAVDTVLRRRARSRTSAGVTRAGGLPAGRWSAGACW